MKEYIPFESAHSTDLLIEVYYALGGLNYFNYKNEARGYYASVTPVKKEENFISFSAMSGIKQLLEPCARKSKKAYEAALKRFTPEIRQLLIDEVTGKLSAKAKLNAISKKLNIALPPRFEGMTEEEILKLPVHIVDGKSNPVFNNLNEARERVDLNKLCGPFGCEARDHLRFETQEAFEVLSR